MDVQCVRERPWGPIAANGYLIEWVKRGDAVKKGDRPVGLFVIWSTPAHRCAKRGSRMLISRSCVYVCVWVAPPCFSARGSDEGGLQCNEMWSDSGGGNYSRAQQQLWVKNDIIDQPDAAA